MIWTVSCWQCQLGVLPLGTGNDLARVLGWGPSCDDDTQLPQILEKLERASTKMLDRYTERTLACVQNYVTCIIFVSLATSTAAVHRWSIMTYEIKIPPKHSCPVTPEEAEDGQVLATHQLHCIHLLLLRHSVTCYTLSKIRCRKKKKKKKKDNTQHIFQLCFNHCTQKKKFSTSIVVRFVNKWLL